jgi:hypothetical protein
MTTHLIAPMDAEAPEMTRALVPWITIDGDEVHGYLVRGFESLDGYPNFDYWFASLEEAMSAGDEFGVERTAWTPREVLPGEFPDR